MAERLYLQGKTVCIVANGPSVSELDATFENFDRDYVIWGGMNTFKPIEDRILKQRGKNFDLVYCSSNTRFEENYDDLMQVKMNPQRVLISSYCCSYYFELSVNEILISDLGVGFNSLSAFLYTIMNYGPSRIILFGADGYVENLNNVYYGQEKYDGENFFHRKITIEKDTKIMNETFWKICDYWNIPRCKIYNCSPKSAITCFDKIDYRNKMENLL